MARESAMNYLHVSCRDCVMQYRTIDYVQASGWAEAHQKANDGHQVVITIVTKPLPKLVQHELTEPLFTL